MSRYEILSLYVKEILGNVPLTQSKQSPEQPGDSPNGKLLRKSMEGRSIVVTPPLPLWRLLDHIGCVHPLIVVPAPSFADSASRRTSARAAGPVSPKIEPLELRDRPDAVD